VNPPSRPGAHHGTHHHRAIHHRRRRRRRPRRIRRHPVRRLGLPPRDRRAGRDKFGYGEILQTGVFLFGRATWDYFSTLWPPRSDPFALALNAADKAVATSREVDLARWQNSRRVEGDVVDWARRESGERDVVLIGSGSVAERLIEAGAVDEYRLRVFPTATGAGRRLFSRETRLDLVSSEVLGPTTLSIYTTEEFANRRSAR
jgi:dihydrofolate reductase